MQAPYENDYQTGPDIAVPRLAERESRGALNRSESYCALKARVRRRTGYDGQPLVIGEQLLVVGRVVPIAKKCLPAS